MLCYTAALRLAGTNQPLVLLCQAEEEDWVSATNNVDLIASIPKEILVVRAQQ